MKTSDISNLVGKILISTPSVANEYLSRSMILICSHDKNGAMGLVINKKIPELSIGGFLEKLKLDSKDIENIDINFGGSLENERCFILHSDEYLSLNSTPIINNISLTISSDIVKVITSKGGPKRKLLCMGCYIWESNQLENEVASSYWIPIDADEALVFGDQKSDKWSTALMKRGSSTGIFADHHGTA